MGMNASTIMGIISCTIIAIFVIIVAKNQAQKGKRLDKLLEMYDNTLKVYFCNPKKYEKYEKEIFDWRRKIDLAKDEYEVISIVENLTSDMNTLEVHALDELISILESFQKWKNGKIE